jgi:putative sugar O-methyltransferase
MSTRTSTGSARGAVSNDHEALDEMIRSMRTAPAQVLPSNFWNYLNELNLRQLSEFGFQNFKRTLARNYFTWVVSPRDDQIAYLVGRLPAHVTARAAARSVVAGAHPPLSRKDSLYYSFLTYLLWEYVVRNVSPDVIAPLQEPEQGNPPHIVVRGRRISQDLANSILEYQSIVSSGLDLSTVRTVLEIGAGYGRTAFVLQRLLPSLRYIVADIPPALYVSQRYLSDQFASRKLFKFRDFRSYSEIRQEFEESQLAFLLPHQIEHLPAQSVDLVLNISSFHEMRPEQLDYYFSQLDRVAAGYVYLKQWKRTTIPYDNIVLEEKDYPIPRAWQQVFWRECAVQTRFFEALLKAR